MVLGLLAYLRPDDQEVRIWEGILLKGFQTYSPGGTREAACFGIHCSLESEEPFHAAVLRRGWFAMRISQFLVGSVGQSMMMMIATGQRSS